MYPIDRTRGRPGSYVSFYDCFFRPAHSIKWQFKKERNKSPSLEKAEFWIDRVVPLLVDGKSMERNVPSN